MKKILIVSVAVILLAVGLFSGCAGNELSQQKLEQMVTDVLTSNAVVKTVKFEVNMLADMEVVGGSDAGKIPVKGSGNGIIDSANRRMQMIMNMTIDIPDKGKQEIPAEYYFVDGWMYMKVSIPEKGDQWLKIKMPDSMWDQKSQLSQQIELLRTAEQINYLGIEDVNGTSCYVVQIIPGSEALRNMMSQVDLPAMGDIDMNKLDLADLFKEITIKEWIARDSFMFIKTEQHMVIEVGADDIGASKSDFQKIIENVNVNMRFYAYNDPVKIELPAEALQAQSISSNR